MEAQADIEPTCDELRVCKPSMAGHIKDRLEDCESSFLAQLRNLLELIGCDLVGLGYISRSYNSS